VQEFLVCTNLLSPAQSAAYRFIVESTAGNEETKLAYAVKLRDCGRAVFRAQNEDFGHRAVAHAVIGDSTSENCYYKSLDPLRPLKDAVIFRESCGPGGRYVL